MANPNRLKIIYQPAQKSVEFELYKNDEFLSDGSKYSGLNRYSNDENKGKFVLQLQGPNFIDDILSPFSPSINPVYIDMVTTKIEMDDFEEMVDDYNTKNKNRIKLLKPASKVLPGMKDCSIFLDEYARVILKNLRELINNLKKINVKGETAKNIVKDLENQASNIEGNLGAFTNNVNICFVGITSTGKSTLINSLLGFELLTMKDDPETSKVYEIKAPKEDEKPYISFEYKNTHITLSWNLNKVELNKKNKEISDFLQIELLKGSVENQLRDIVIKLNNKDNNKYIGKKISIGIKIPFDTDLVHYTIFDTPGTDSLDKTHQSILMDTLYSQTDTIMAFVINAKNMECSGNTILLENIKKADEGTNKTKIDLDRSFFILNTADDASNLDEKYMKSIIDKKALESGENFEVKLENKRLFFTSAKLALLSQKTELTEDEEIDKEALELKASKKKYYQYNRIGESRLRSERLKNNTEDAYKCASDKNNQLEENYINSGIWSLREEISNYGNKYASAVKLAALSQTINKVIDNVNSKVNELTLANKQDIEEINKELEEFKLTTLKNIESIVDNRIHHNKDNFDKAIGEQVGLSGQKTIEVEKNIKNLFERIFGKIQGIGVVSVNKTDEFMKGFYSITRTYFEEVNENLRKYLINLKTELLEEIKKLITSDTNISEEIKKLIEEIEDPEIPSVETTLKDAVIDIHSDENKLMKFFTNFTSGVLKLESKKKLQESFISLWSNEFENVRANYKNEFLKANGLLGSDIKKKFGDRVEDLKEEFTEYKENLKGYGKIGDLLTKFFEESLKEREVHHCKLFARKAK